MYFSRMNKSVGEDSSEVVLSKEFRAICELKMITFEPCVQLTMTGLKRYDRLTVIKFGQHHQFPISGKYYEPYSPKGIETIVFGSVYNLRTTKYHNLNSHYNQPKHVFRFEGRRFRKQL